MPSESSTKIINFPTMTDPKGRITHQRTDYTIDEELKNNARATQVLQGANFYLQLLAETIREISASQVGTSSTSPSYAVASLSARFKGFDGRETRRGRIEMDEWLKTLIEKLDEDRRESESRIERSIGRIERVIERQADAMEALRKEVKEQNDRINHRIDTAYYVFVGTTIATFVAVAGMVISVILYLRPLGGGG